MTDNGLIEAQELINGSDAVIFDCRFSLSDSQEGRAQYLRGHIPGAQYLDLENDLSGPVRSHGGRHPLPDPTEFAAKLARCGVGVHTPVVAYDDSRLAFAARLWWLMRALGYRPPRLLNGGYRAFVTAGGASQVEVLEVLPCPSVPVTDFDRCCDRNELRVAQQHNSLLVDSREAMRYAGLEELIDPVPGHIPGAINRPWQGVTTEDGRVMDNAALQQHWDMDLQAQPLVVYCGSGVTACVNLFSLALLGAEDATLYAGSWSDWCSYLGEGE